MKKLGNIKVDWNLRLLYDSLNDKSIKSDITELETIANNFYQKWSERKDYLRRADVLLDALRDEVRVKNAFSESVFIQFLWLMLEKEPDNPKIIPMLVKLLERYIEAWNKTEFFIHTLREIPEKKQNKFLKAKTLGQYRRLLEVYFNEYNKKHSLPLEAEKMENTAVLSSHIWWYLLGEQLRKNLTVYHGEQEMSFGEAKELLPSFPAEDRIEVNNKMIAQQKSVALAANIELNAMIGFQKTVDNKCKYSRPFSHTLHSDEMNDLLVEHLIKTVSNSFPISHRFYELHKKLLNMETLGICDIQVPLGNISSFDFDFEKIVPIAQQAFYAFDPRCVAWFESYLKNGQIDVYPKKGKSPGAYCMYGGKSSPTFIYLNYVNGLNSAVTLAHECGHAFHWEFCRNIRISLFRDHSTALAETASTFFEKMMFDRIFKKLSEEDKIIALHGRLMNDMDFVFRQTALFNYEVELHRLIRKKGAATEFEMTSLMAKHLQSYLGPAVQVQHDDGYLYATRTHLRDFFYHYTYVFGDIVSGELFDRWKKDKSFSTKIVDLLSSRSDYYVDDLIKDNTGVDITEKSFFQKRLSVISARIDQLEALIANKK